MKHKTTEMLNMLHQEHIVKHMESLTVEEQCEMAAHVDSLDLSVLNADDIEDNNTVNLTFLVEKLGSEALNADDLSITWVEDDQRVSSTLNPDLAGSAVSFSTANGQGTISLNLNTLGDDVKREGTLLVKYGHLQRKIKVVTVKTQQFIPAWVSTEVYGAVAGDKGSGENVTLVFTIPETCPAELFP